MYRGHLLGGLAAYFIAIIIISVIQGTFIHYGPGLLAALAGSLFPDIDIRSKGQRLFLKLLLIAVLLCLYLKAAVPLTILLFFSVLPIIFPHRGLFHDTIFVLILSFLFTGALIYSMPSKTETIVITMLFFFIGVLSHLILDKGMKKTFYQ